LASKIVDREVTGILFLLLDEALNLVARFSTVAVNELQVFVLRIIVLLRVRNLRVVQRRCPRSHLAKVTWRWSRGESYRLKEKRQAKAATPRVELAAQTA
jgi:hypothetical protein